MFNTNLFFQPNWARFFLTFLLGYLLAFTSHFVQAQELAWAKLAGGTNSTQGFAIAVDGPGNAYTTGEFRGATTFGPGEVAEITLTSDGFAGIFVAKYTTGGDLIWAKHAADVSSESDNEITANSIAVDNSGNTYITGEYSGIGIFGPGEASEITLISEKADEDDDGFTGPLSNIFLAKYTAEGELVWVKHAGGVGRDLVLDSSGNIYITGYFFRNTATTPDSGETDETQLNTGNNSVILAKYAANGDLIWTNNAEFESGVSQNNSVAVDDSGNAYITGEFNGAITFGVGGSREIVLTGNMGFDDIYVAKYASGGDLIWANSAGGIGIDRSRDLAVDGSGNAFITGFFGRTATFDPGGANETLLNSDVPFPFFLAKYTSAGNLAWVKSAGGDDNSSGRALAVDSSGNAYVTGLFSNAIFGEGETGETTLTSDNFTSDIFVAKYTPAGSLISAKRAGGPGTLLSNSLAVDIQGNTYITGHFTDNVTFGSGEDNETTLISISNFDHFFLAKFSDLNTDASAVVEIRVAASSDDAEENTATGKVNRGSSDLELVDQGVLLQLVGMRFNGLNIPEGAIITNAYIQFQADETHSGTTTLKIEGQATDNALTFTNANANISSRDRTSAVVDWSPVPWTTVGEAGPDQQTPDITSVAQEIINRPGWSSGNSLAIIISGRGRRATESFNGDAAGAPVLHVEYITTPVNIVESRVAASADDAEENTATGKINRGSSDLELVDQGALFQLVGMRFNSLSIPQGATITNASIQFQADEMHSGATNLMIEGEASDTALAFTNVNANISSRTLTATTVEWTPAPWTTISEAGPDQQTPDITSIVQEIVDRPGWSSGNSLAVIISGSGRRAAESFNGDAGAAPLLHVEYTAGTETN